MIRLKSTSLSVLAVCLSSGIALAQSSSLQNESRRELQRIYGTTPRPPAVATAALRSARIRALSDSLATGTAVEVFASLNLAATPESIDSLALLDVFGKTSGQPRYYLLWHKISLDATSLDHRAAAGDEANRFHEQFGPARTARALAIVHLAMFEAANLFEKRYETLVDGAGAIDVSNASMDAAVVEAAYRTLAWLYDGLDASPNPQPASATACMSDNRFSLTGYHACTLKTFETAGALPPEVKKGLEIGGAVAGLIIAKRSHDKSNVEEPLYGSNGIPRRADPDDVVPSAQWNPDPVSNLQTELGGHWGEVTPFVLRSGDALRPTESPYAKYLPKPPAALSSLPSFDVVRDWGAETRLNPSGQPGDFSHDGLFLAQFWAYDGTANLCAPARLYNQIALAGLRHIEQTPADATPTALDPASTSDIARYFSLLNVAMGDASIAAWDSKYAFQFARPVTYIRAADAAAHTGPGEFHSLWFPIGAQVTNSAQSFNITPPFPSYPSGHAVFGGAVFGLMRQFIQPKAQFSFRSDEFNGLNRDVFNYIRCSPNDELTRSNSIYCRARQFSLDCAERENADSRVFMGVHWLFDADDGIYMGNRVAKAVFATMQRVTTHDAPLVFSATVSGAQTARQELVCGGNLRYPPMWAKKFGPLTIREVD